MSQLTVIPRPNNADFKDGSYIIRDSLTISSEFPEILSHIKILFPAVLNEADENGDVIFIKDGSLRAEAYLLRVTGEGIKIRASNETGAFYAIQTLRQLIEENKENGNRYLPLCEIKDEPRFVHRGFMLDEARHFFGKAFVKKTLDIMGLLKLNTLHWHLTDDQGWRIEIKKYPLLTEKGSIRKSTQLNMLGSRADKSEYGKGLYYTQDDIKEIVEYAKNLHINIIPEIDMPGHLMSAISCYPELSCFNEDVSVSERWGVLKTIGCAGKESLYSFVMNVIDELSELFPYEYFHIGGDEVPKNKWKKCPDCQRKIKELGLKDENALQAYFNNEIEKHLKSKGKIMLGWNEILSSGTLSDSVIAQWWTGNIKKSGAEKWMKKGNRIILSQMNYLYFDHFYARKDLRKTYSLDFDVLNIDKKYAEQILGIEAPQWTEYVRNEEKFNFNTYPRMQALSEINWTDSDNKDFEDFMIRLNKFSKLLKTYGIIEAPQKAYLLKGFKGLFRKATEQIEWLKNPNAEYERYKNK